MKTALAILLTVVGTVGLSACASMPATDSFDEDQYSPSREETLYGQYQGFRSEVGYGEAFIDRLNAVYSSY
jgi:hypothetical protein